MKIKSPEKIAKAFEKTLNCTHKHLTNQTHSKFLLTIFDLIEIVFSTRVPKCYQRTGCPESVLQGYV